MGTNLTGFVTPEFILTRVGVGDLQNYGKSKSLAKSIGRSGTKSGRLVRLSGAEIQKWEHPYD
jgi:hypothetical protein